MANGYEKGKLIGEACLDEPFAVHLGTVLNFTKNE